MYVYVYVFDCLSWPALFLYNPAPYLPQLCCLLQKINFGSNLSCPSPQGISLIFMCCFPPPPPTLNRTYILCCLFCLFILESGKVQQGHCQFTGICVLHGPLSPLMLEGRLMYEALTQFSVPRRLLSGVNLLA